MRDNCWDMLLVAGIYFCNNQNPVHVHDFQATLLHLLGVDHEKLTYEFQGRRFRLTDVEGKFGVKIRFVSNSQVCIS